MHSMMHPNIRGKFDTTWDFTTLNHSIVLIKLKKPRCVLEWSWWRPWVIAIVVDTDRMTDCSCKANHQETCHTMKGHGQKKLRFQLGLLSRGTTAQNPLPLSCYPLPHRISGDRCSPGAYRILLHTTSEHRGRCAQEMSVPTLRCAMDSDREAPVCEGQTLRQMEELRQARPAARKEAVDNMQSQGMDLSRGDRRGRPTMIRLSAGAPVGEGARRSSRAPSLDPATPRFPIRSVVGLWNSEATECPSESADRERERDRGRGRLCSGGCPFSPDDAAYQSKGAAGPPFPSSHSAPVAWVTPMLA
jgi:hypothetical protein